MNHYSIDDEWLTVFHFFHFSSHLSVVPSGRLAASCRSTTPPVAPTATSSTRSTAAATRSTWCPSAGWVSACVVPTVQEEKQPLGPRLEPITGRQTRGGSSLEAFNHSCVRLGISGTWEISHRRRKLWIINRTKWVQSSAEESGLRESRWLDETSFQFPCPFVIIKTMFKVSQHDHMSLLICAVFAHSALFSHLGTLNLF